MIDSHFHLWTADESTPEKRGERAAQLRGEMRARKVDRLVCGPQLPFKVFESSYGYTEMLAVNDEKRARVRSGNVQSLIE